MDTKAREVPYFFYQFGMWRTNQQHLPIKDDNIEGLIKKLRDGKKLFNVISKVQDKNHRLRIHDRKFFAWFSFKYAFFETRREGEIDEKGVVQKGEYEQVGPLLLPRSETLDRDEMESMVSNLDYPLEIRQEFERALTEYKDASLFCRRDFSYSPFDSDKVLILEKGQLK